MTLAIAPVSNLFTVSMLPLVTPENAAYARGLLFAGTWSLMSSVVLQGTLTAIVIIALVNLAAGHLLGGPEEDARTVLAHATVSRHPGVAIAVASLTDQPLAPIGVLLAVLVSAVAMVPYTIWRKRRRAAGPPPGVRPPARIEA